MGDFNAKVGTHGLMIRKMAVGKCGLEGRNVKSKIFFNFLHYHSLYCVKSDHRSVRAKMKLNLKNEELRGKIFLEH